MSVIHHPGGLRLPLRSFALVGRGLELCPRLHILREPLQVCVKAHLQDFWKVTAQVGIGNFACTLALAFTDVAVPCRRNREYEVRVILAGRA
eukprot:scaffold2326_cov286-Pinguiococcus_pyrenoidosus.AAC.9